MLHHLNQGAVNLSLSKKQKIKGHKKILIFEVKSYFF